MNKLIIALSLSAAYADCGNNQVGKTIGGSDDEAKFGRSVSLNEAGTRLAAGGPGAESAKGHVRVLDLKSGNWKSVGDDIDGSDKGKDFGTYLELDNSGDTLCAGGKGVVRCYVESGDKWTQKGKDIEGGSDICPVEIGGDGDRVATVQGGKVAIYDWDGGNGWNKKKGSVEGYNVDMSRDGTVLAVTSKDYVIVYDVKGRGDTWKEKYKVRGGGASEPSLSYDAKTLAVATKSGSKRVITLYNEKGEKIGKELPDDDKTFKGGVELSGDGKTCAVGNAGEGSVGIYKRDGDEFVYEGKIQGSGAFGTGVSLSKDGSSVAIGEPDNDGQVEVFEVKCSGGDDPGPGPDPVKPTPRPTENKSPGGDCKDKLGNECKSITKENYCHKHVMSDGFLARDGCQKTCGTCNTCTDLSPSQWAYLPENPKPGEEGKKLDCRNIAKTNSEGKPVYGRCKYEDSHDITAMQACPKSCGRCDGDTISFAAKFKDEDTVAVGVKTLVAICVLAGVALGGVATLLAPKAKSAEATPLLAEEKA